MKVPDKAIIKYLARRGNYKGRGGLLEKKIFDFWLYWFGGDEAAAKKAMSEMRRKGFGELAMCIFVAEFEEWRARKRKDSATENWKKALPMIKKTREEKKRTEPDRFSKSFPPSSYSEYRRKC